MASRKQKSQRRRRSQRSQRRSKKQGGAVLSGAPLAYSLSNDWSSKMSLGQGGDYLKYHVGQHGGALDGAPLSEIGGALPAAMRGPAHIGGLDSAFSQIAGMKDQAGGKRHKRSKHSTRRSKKHGRKAKKHGGKRSRRHSKKRSTRRHSKKQGGRKRSQRSRKQRKSQGGALGYAPFGGASMLLDSAGYAKAGLTPQWSAGAEFDAAAARASM